MAFKDDPDQEKIRTDRGYWIVSQFALASTLERRQLSYWNGLAFIRKGGRVDSVKG